MMTPVIGPKIIAASATIVSFISNVRKPPIPEMRKTNKLKYAKAQNMAIVTIFLIFKELEEVRIFKYQIKNPRTGT